MKDNIKKTVSVLLSTVIIMMSSVLFSSASGADSVYVSPDGNDLSDGTITSPLATLGGVIEKIKKDGLTDVTAYFREGDYIFSDTLKAQGLDCGLTLKPYNGENVTFTTASPVTGFTEETVNGVRCFTKRFDEGIGFYSVHSDTHDTALTRYPETGYLSVKSIDERENLYNEKNTPWSLTLGQKCFYGDPSALPEEIRNEKDVLVRILHYWHDEMCPAQSIDLKTGRILMQKPSSMLIRDIDRFFLENVFCALNKPGEYYIDRDAKTLYYVPFENEQPDTLTLYCAEKSVLAELTGCSGVTFENIRFAHTAFRTITKYRSNWVPGSDMDFPQACVDVDCALTVQNSSDINFINCEFTDIGCSAVYIGPGCGECAVKNCYFENIGANAVFIDGANCLPGEAGFTHDITVENNEIYRYGRRYFCAIGVLLRFCDTASVSHNEIHDGYYTAISDGWVWGYDYHVTKNIKIEANLIYDIGQGWLSDMGGIYTLGRQPGTVLKYNVIHNVAADRGEGGYGGWGIYFDEGSSYILAENNLMFCCGSQGFHTHYGDSNSVRNCISVLNGEGAARPGARYMGYNATDYQSCIFVADAKTPIYANMGKGDTFSESGNLFWNLTEKDFISFAKGETSDLMTYNTATNKGYLGENDIIADPCFTDIRNYDFSFASTEAADAIGFEPWDYGIAGTLKDTVIGIDRAGGQTPYTENARPVDTVKFKSGFGFFLADFFRKVFAPLLKVLSALGFNASC